MATNGLEQVMDSWINDRGFREAMRDDPDAALEDRGIELNSEERETLEAIDWNESDEKLQARISKLGLNLLGL